MTFVGLALALISACGAVGTGDDDPHGGSNTGTGSDTGSGGGSGGGTGSGGGGTSVSPRAGAWDYGEVTPVSSTCSALTPHGEDGMFAIDQVLPASFRILPGDGTAPFLCTWNSVGFSCPARASFVADSRPGVDAVITGHATATGRFSDGGHGTGRQNLKIDCAGTQCGRIGVFPCDLAVDFAILAE